MPTDLKRNPAVVIQHHARGEVFDRLAPVQTDTFLVIYTGPTKSGCIRVAPHQLSESYTGNADMINAVQSDWRSLLDQIPTGPEVA